MKSTIGIKIAMCWCVFIVLSCGGKAEVQQERQSVPVRTARVAEKDIRVRVRTSGTTARKEQMDLSFKIGGIIREIAVREGDFVTDGTRLATLDQTEIQARVDQVQVGFDKADRDLKNARKLHADSVTTHEQLLDMQSVWEDARASLTVARHNLAFASIQAPSDGFILKKMGEVNEMIAPGRPLFVFSSSAGDMVLRAGVTDRDILHLALGDSATVKLDAYPGQPIPAAISELPATSDALTGLYEIELTVAGGRVRLLPGMTGSTEIYTQKVERLPVVPIEALTEADVDRGYVYVLDGQTVYKRGLSIGTIIGDEVSVKAGLLPGETVVTEGAAYLQDKAEVKIVPDAKHNLGG